MAVGTANVMYAVIQSTSPCVLRRIALCKLEKGEKGRTRAKVECEKAQLWRTRGTGGLEDPS